MMYVDTKHISDNRHSWNVRRVEELQVEIALKEKELKEAQGFFERSKVRSEIKKMERRQIKHGEEVLRYEFSRKNNR